MAEIIASIVVAVVAGTTAVIQVTRWIWQRGYMAGQSAAYQEAARAAQKEVATEVQALRNEVQILRNLLESGTPPPGTDPKPGEDGGYDTWPKSS
jgi:hypothetical protein